MLEQRIAELEASAGEEPVEVAQRDLSRVR
jgi:hypothetical protein